MHMLVFRNMANLKKSAIESRTCECGCKRKFDCHPSNPKRFFDRGCASRTNAKQSIKIKPRCRRSKSGIKERKMEGFMSMNIKLREYEDKQIQLGKMPPRQSMRDVINLSIAEQVASSKRKKKRPKKK